MSKGKRRKIPTAICQKIISIIISLEILATVTGVTTTGIIIIFKGMATTISIISLTVKLARMQQTVGAVFAPIISIHPTQGDKEILIERTEEIFSQTGGGGRISGTGTFRIEGGDQEETGILGEEVLGEGAPSAGTSRVRIRSVNCNTSKANINRMWRPISGPPHSERTRNVQIFTTPSNAREPVGAFAPECTAEEIRNRPNAARSWGREFAKNFIQGRDVQSPTGFDGARESKFFRW